MKRTLLIAYQCLTGIPDTLTGLLLIVAPHVTLRLMKLNAAPDTLPFLSYIGVFVLSVGLACLYGGWLAIKHGSPEKLEVVWLLTAITRGLVAVFVLVKVSSDSLEPGWNAVSMTDGAFAILQVAGLARGWLPDVRD